jgi:hypothetical protein
MLHGLMLAAAIEAGTTEVNAPQPPSFGAAGSVVLGEVVAARALTAAPAPIGVIGAGPGTLSAGWLSFASSDNGQWRMQGISAEPNFDVFVADRVSLGAIVGGGVARLSDEHQDLKLWHATFMPRVGRVFEITSDIAVWARVAAGFTLFEWAVENDVAKIFRATADVPFVFRLTRHVALQAGPQISYVHHLGGLSNWQGFSGGVSGGLSIVF